MHFITLIPLTLLREGEDEEEQTEPVPVREKRSLFGFFLLFCLFVDFFIDPI